ncbi:hypothetical protein [Janibacter sp. GS2]|uniref:hypothetical protein n=1 Tax=Janibacter sp. GS2 TaxID=3442646 RepID=UPI003EB866B4
MDTRIRALLTGRGQICTTTQLRAVDADEATVARLVREGSLVRLRRGLFAAGPVWQAATPERRLSLRTRAVLLDRPGAVASHASAAVIHGLPLWGVATSTVDLVCTTPRRRVRSGLRLHPWPAGVSPTSTDGVPVVPLPVAIAQMAAECGSIPALVCLDRALHEGAVTTGAVAEAGALLLGPRGRLRIESMIERSDPGCESVGETRTRALLIDLGLPVRTQVTIRDGEGFVGRVDFLVGERVVVEFDGMLKYGGADGRRALQSEKAREDRLRAAGYVVVRLVWADLDDPERVLDLVHRASRRAA